MAKQKMPKSKGRKPSAGGGESLTDNFEFELVGGEQEPFAGYVSSGDPTILSPQVMIAGSQNVYKTLAGSLANRPGLKKRGQDDETQAGTVSSFEWESNLGIIYPVRQNNGNLEIEFDPGTGLQWYSFLTGLPSNICSYAPWFDPTLSKDELLIVNGQQQIIMWTGGIGIISAAANSAGIIEGILGPNNTTNAGTGEFSSGGTGYVQGDILPVSGGNNDALIEVDSVVPGGVGTVTISAPGSGYTLGDLVSNTTGTTNAIFQVTAIGGGGVVTALAVVAAGVGISLGAAQATVTVNATGTGLTVNITVIGNTIASWHFTQNGSGYSLPVPRAPLATTGGTGTLASIWILALITGRATLQGTSTIPQAGFSGALTPTNGVLVLKGGSFISAGITYTYTVLGDNGQSFLGVSTDPTPLINQVIISSATITDTSATSTDAPYTASDSSQQYAAQLESNFTNDAISVVNNQVHLICYTSRLIHVSSVDHFDHYDVYQLDIGVVRTPGYPDILTLDSSGRAVWVQKGNAVVFGSRGDSYLVTRKSAIYNQGASFDALSYEIVTVQKEISSELSSPLGQDFIGSVGDSILYIDTNNQLREYGTLRNIVNPVYPVLSIDVYTELAALDMTGGHLRCVGEEAVETVYIVVPKKGNVYIYQIRQDIDAVGNVTAERLWQSPFIWPISRIAVIEGVSFGHSSQNPMIYQLWNTGQWHDDSPTNQSIPYTSAFLLAYQSSGRRQGKTVFDKIFYEGYSTEATTFTGIVNLEYLGSENILNPVITSPDDPATFFAPSVDGSLGENSMGEEPPGDVSENDDAESTPTSRIKFRTIVGIAETNVYEYALGGISSAIDDRWELLFLGSNAILSSTDQGSELMK